LNTLLDRGAKNIANANIALTHHEFQAKVLLPHGTHSSTEIDFFRLWYSKELYSNILLPSINKHLQDLRENAGSANAGHRYDTTAQELEKFIISHWLH
jgi:hypothetical protein